MAGTCIEQVRLTKVVDGDTIKVDIDGEQETLRLACLDTEESYPGGSKPVTNAGKKASQWAKAYFGVNEEGFPSGDITVDIEFDTNDPREVCEKKHRGNYGRLLCYVHYMSENYNIEAIKKGWSPYFVKYGRSRLYHNEFMNAEAAAQGQSIGIWDPEVNAWENKRDYDRFIPWWHLRESVVEDYRENGVQANVKSVRLDYVDICEAARSGSQLTVLCDLQSGINRWIGGGALILAGSPQHKFNLWMPEAESQDSQRIIRLIQTRYAGKGRGYVYVNGEASLYPKNDNGKPQIVLTDPKQLRDYC